MNAGNRTSLSRPIFSPVERIPILVNLFTNLLAYFAIYHKEYPSPLQRLCGIRKLPCCVRDVALSVLSQHSLKGPPILRTQRDRPEPRRSCRVGVHLRKQVQNFATHGMSGVFFRLGTKRRFALFYLIRKLRVDNQSWLEYAVNTMLERENQ